MKKVISLLIVAVLLIFGTASLLAEESDSFVKDNSVPSAPIVPSLIDGNTLCGDGNGGGGCPG